jgi:hypothetical protein
MAILGEVIPSRESLEVGYPSEPVLVYAAHPSFKERQPNLVDEQLNGLNTLAQQGLVREGIRGELAAKFILLQALSKLGCDNPGHFQFNYCKVRDLLQGLQVDTSAISNRLLDGFVHFSHWANAEGNIQLASIAAAFYRGAGIICKRNQETIDLFIPVLLNSVREWWKENGGLPVYRQTGGVVFRTRRLGC